MSRKADALLDGFPGWNFRFARLGYTSLQLHHLRSMTLVSFFLFVSVCRRLLKNLPIGSNIGFLAPLVRIPSLMTQVLYSVNPWTSSPDSKATIYPRNVADADLPEKFAKELLWLAEKLLDCGGMEEAIQQWSTNPSLAELSLCASPRVQKSLVRLSGISLTLRYLVLNLLH